MTKMTFILISAFIMALSLSTRAPAGPRGQEGNGGFVYKDRERSRKADRLIDNGIDELKALAEAASAKVFADLKPKVDQKEFVEIIKYTTCIPYIMGERRLPNDGDEALMMDYKTDSSGRKYIVVYAPMFVAMMYMDDEVAAKKFFQVTLVHEILHHFSYSEEKADAVAPVLYEKLVKGGF